MALYRQSPSGPLILYVFNMAMGQNSTIITGGMKSSVPVFSRAKDIPLASIVGTPLSEKMSAEQWAMQESDDKEGIKTMRQGLESRLNPPTPEIADEVDEANPNDESQGIPFDPMEISSRTPLEGGRKRLVDEQDQPSVVQAKKKPKPKHPITEMVKTRHKSYNAL
jgi:hypothetical protein